jgi:phenylacetate-CoA ligase/benzoylacetate-CoA ligase
MDEFFDPEFDTLPWDEVLGWQRDQVWVFLASLTGRCQHFAERLAGIDPGATDRDGAWAAVPLMAKSDLRDAQSAHSPYRLGKTQAVPDRELEQVIASSGTTGTPTFFGLTGQDRKAWEFSIANMFFTAGIRRDSVVAHTVGMPMVAGGLPYADAIRRIGATLVWLGGQTPARTAEIMSRLRVDAMVSTASYASFLGERISQELGRPARGIGLRTVIGGGEPGLAQPQIREGLRDVWGAERVSETMGLGDVMSGMWAECHAEQGMHFTAARHVMVELIDPETGDPVAWESGARGEAVYTTFSRQATPVVRFRSRDHLQVQATACVCGRTAPLIRCVGRTDDMLIYKAMNVFPSAIRDVALAAAGERLCGAMRIRKERADQVRFEDPIPLEVESDLSRDDWAAVAAEIAEAVRQHLRVRVAVQIVPQGTIPVSEYKNALVYTER